MKYLEQNLQIGLLSVSTKSDLEQYKGMVAWDLMPYVSQKVHHQAGGDIYTDRP